ncbi:MAG: PDZ domain-containing protein [Thermoleophilia bacterium]|nr:PDZ domain-containing protein [Thermoleophilia bacterium]
MSDIGYLRQPTVHDDRVVFACEDDLWEVPLAGGTARRLTSGRGVASRPIFSPDGATIAFTSSDESHPEVWAMPSEGGSATRLTHLGGFATARAWTPDGDVVFATSVGQAFARVTELQRVAASGDGFPQSLGYGPGADIAWSDDGKVVLGRHTVDPARWKRYRGGLAGQLWVDRDGSGTFRRILRDLGGNIGTPLWIGRRIWFVSDHEGVGNLYSCRATGSDVRRHTSHGDFYVRFPQTDGRTVVYQCGARLYRLDVSGSGEPEQIEVELHSPRAQRQRRVVDAARYLQGYEVHPAGHSVAVEVRGQAHSMPLFERAPRRWDSGEGVRSRHGQWLAGGSPFIAVSDADGEEGIDVFDDGATTPSRRLSLDIGRVVELAASPTDPVVAIANHRGELLLVDVAAGTLHRVDTSEHDRIGGPAWSPDGRWIAYSHADTARTSSIRIADARTRKVQQVTRTEFRDEAPAWDPKGRWLLFTSWREFAPVYDSHTFDLGFPRGARPMLVTLRDDVRSPFDREPKGFGTASDASSATDTSAGTTTAKARPKSAAKAKAASTAKTTAKAGAKGAAKAKAAKDPVEITFAGIEDRVIAFPVTEGRYLQVAQAGEKVLLLVREPHASRSWDSEPTSSRLESFDLTTGSTDVLVNGIDSFRLAADGATLVYRRGRALRAIKAGDKPDDSAKGFGRTSGWIDLSRLTVDVDPPAEWRQMLLEAWRLQRDQFWVADMSGVDWDAVRDRYLPLVDLVASRAEFSDLAWEMQGELGTSHAYEYGGDHRLSWEFTSGHLGIDYARDPKSGAYRIGRILRGDSWNAKHGSPLAAPGLGVKEGATIVSIGGEAVGRDRSPHELLVGRAGKAVELELRAPRARAVTKVAVTTLRDESDLRYREWVEHNRALVHERTDGQVGYLHIPDMGPHGFAEFHRSWPVEAQRGGLVVDVRYNGGGHVSQLLLEKLQRRAIGFGLSRWNRPETYPSDAVLGPIVAITNEFAGSDGDIFSHSFKMLGIGPLVGTRTWGGVIGIHPRHALADGSVTTQPEYAFWFRDTGFNVENYGTDPDHEVDMAPQDYVAGRDPQIDKALQLIERGMKRTPAALPDFGERPVLALPTLG